MVRLLLLPTAAPSALLPPLSLDSTLPAPTHLGPLTPTLARTNQPARPSLVLCPVYSVCSERCTWPCVFIGGCQTILPCSAVVVCICCAI